MTVLPRPPEIEGWWARSLFNVGDDRLLVAGHGYGPEPGTPGAAIVTRVLRSGEIDTSFGQDGQLAVAEGPGAPIRSLWGFTVQPGGDMVLAGWQNDAGILSFRALRFDQDGNRDLSFGDGGVASVEIDAQLGYLRAATTDTEGRILLGGSMIEPGAHHAELDFVLARLEADGDPDPTFGESGVVRANVGTSGPIVNVDVMNALDVAPDGDVVAVGDTSWSDYAGSGDLAILRLDAAGARVGGFGDGGVVVGAIGDRSTAWDVEAATNGVTVAGYSETGTALGGGVIARYDETGALDPGFGEPDTPGTTHLPELTQVRHLTELQDGGLLATGDAYVSAAGVARLLPEGLRDQEFGQAGLVLLDLNDETEYSGNEFASPALTQQAGRVVVGVRVEPLEGRNGADVVVVGLHGRPTVRTTLTSTPPESSGDTTPVFEFTADRDLAAFTCRIDAGSWFECTSPLELGPLPFGQHVFSVAAISEGVADPTPADYSFRIEEAPQPEPDPDPQPEPDLEVVGARFLAQRIQRPAPPGVAVAAAAGASESVDVRARGNIKLPRGSVRLTRVWAVAAAGDLAPLALTPRTTAGAARVRRAIESRRRVVARISIVVIDRAGNSVARELVVRLRPDSMR